MLRLVSWIAAFWLLAASAVAQELRVTAGFDRDSVAPGEPVTFTITVSGSELATGRILPSPDLRAFDRASGPMTGQSSEIRFVNGAMSKRENLSFSWQLVASNQGRAVVPPCTFSAGTQSLTTPRAEVLVDPNAQGQARRGGGASGRTPGHGARRDPRRPWTEPVRRIGEGMSLRTTVSHPEAFVGQAIVIQDILTFDTNVNTYKEASSPEFPGFSKKRNTGIRPEGRRVQDPATGHVHSEAVVGQWIVVPLTPGRKELAGHSYSFFVASPDPMERLMGAESEVVRESAPFTIEVLPLPDGAPAGFSGAVGSFQITASLAATSLGAGDGTQLTVVVRGKGSFESVTAPTLPLPPGLKAFPPEVLESVDFDADGQVQGRKTFTFPILAVDAGRHEIPGIAWAFFDPQSRRYVERSTEPLALDAAGGGSDVALSTPNAPPIALETAGSDIVHPRGSLPTWRPDLSSTGFPSWLAAIAVAGPALNILLAAGTFLGRLRQRDPATRRAHGAPALARKRLADAASALARGKRVEAADAAARAIAGLVSDRLGLGAELAPPEAAAALVGAGEAELATRVQRFLSACDFVRFASGTAADAQRLLREADELLAPLARIEQGRPE